MMNEKKLSAVSYQRSAKAPTINQVSLLIADC